MHQPAPKRKKTTPSSAPALTPLVESNVTPLPDAGFPIVGIGASAGGLAAFEEFFSGIPDNTVGPGMAFILVQHLDPTHKSILTELVRRFTRLPVIEVEDGMLVQPNRVYIIPPNRDMALINRQLQLLEPSAPRGLRLPIDFLFQSLAEDQHERAIGIVLSGTGSDGSAGIRAIKSEGGLVMVQKPESAEYAGMPSSAIATGLIDYELPPAQMPARLLAYVAHASGQTYQIGSGSNAMPETMIKKIFVLLRIQTGHDFSKYTPNTLHRRIERRLAVHQIATIANYITHLKQSPDEVNALFRDLLIGVTRFFRDPEAFRLLEQTVVPQILANKNNRGVIRAWSAGCSTGEEAYSLAILLIEAAEARNQSLAFQVFATDIDNQAIAIARAGIYPASIAADISAERLARFFTLEPGGATYRIQKSLRDMLIFSEQDLAKDPPFSKLDLISCRNVMIYMNSTLQKKLMPIFHYALNTGGTLFLGTSESTGDFAHLFSALDIKHKIYQRKDDFIGRHPAVMPPFVPLIAAIDVAIPRQPAGKSLSAIKPHLQELTEQALLQQVFAAGALVNRQGDILYLHGRTGMFLEPAPGEAAINNILKMAREGLRDPLTMALYKVAEIQEKVCHPGLHVKTNGHFTTVNLTVCPVSTGSETSPANPWYLVILEEAAVTLNRATAEEAGAAPAADDSGGFTNPTRDARIAALEQELRTKTEYIQSVLEEMQSSTEELKSSNEELQSVNEEMQSTNEGLETSKEELQSVNEELSTVNTELQTKMTDLTRANNDMNNLLSGTGIATVFVDHQLRILRFTPAAHEIINLIPSDVGRSVSHIVANLVGYDRLVADTQAVLDTLVLKEREVQTTTGKWHTLRIQPYRTLTNVIEGAVISFIDITEIVKARETLRKANDLLRLAVVVRDAHDALTVQDLEGHIIAWNPGAERLYGWSEAEALTMNVRDRIPEESQDSALATLIQLSRPGILAPYRTQRIAKGGAIVDVSIISTALVNKDGTMYAIATTERKIEDSKG